MDAWTPKAIMEAALMGWKQSAALVFVLGFFIVSAKRGWPFPLNIVLTRKPPRGNVSTPTP